MDLLNFYKEARENAKREEEKRKKEKKPKVELPKSDYAILMIIVLLGILLLSLYPVIGYVFFMVAYLIYRYKLKKAFKAQMADIEQIGAALQDHLEQYQAAIETVEKTRNPEDFIQQFQVAQENLEAALSISAPYPDEFPTKEIQEGLTTLLQQRTELEIKFARRYFTKNKKQVTRKELDKRKHDLLQFEGQLTEETITVIKSL